METIVRLLGELPSSDMDHTLVFPIYLAGSMTNDSRNRDFCKRRLSPFDGSIGNMTQVRLVIEAMWQKRDISGGPVELQTIVREQGMHLLLL